MTTRRATASKPVLLIPAAFLTVLASACSTEVGPITATVADTRHEAQIATTYALNPHLRSTLLEVRVREGRATLAGTVEDSVTRDLAQEIARGVTGITHIDNQIVIEPDYQPKPTAAGEISFGASIDDATITAAIKSKLLWSRHAGGLSTEIVTRDGKVTLRGTADSDEAREQAVQLARHTRGVGSVDNQITVRRATAPTVIALDTANQIPGNTLSDSWITAKVKSTLLYSSNVSGRDIAVTTADGVVVLSGALSDAPERALAIALSENVRGVKRVEATGLRI